MAGMPSAVSPARVWPSGVFEFPDQRQPASYFVPYSFYCARHPDSLFAQHRIINLRTKTGSLALTDDTLTERDGNAVTEVRADNKQALSGPAAASFRYPLYL